MAQISASTARGNSASLARPTRRVNSPMSMPYIENDDAGFFRGIVLAAALVAPFWAAVIYVLV